MEKVIRFKKDCAGFVDKNYRDFTKPSFCWHYCSDGRCMFFDNHPECDDVEEVQNGTT